jgi:hypothetical protein
MSCGRYSLACQDCGRLAAHGYQTIYTTKGEIALCRICSEKPFREDRIVDPRHYRHCKWCNTPEMFERYGLDYLNQCKECSGSMLNTYDQFQEVLQDVVDFCRIELGLQVDLDYRLTLATSEELLRLAGKRAIGLWRRDRGEMVVLGELPESCLAGVLAHEHTHAWQNVHCPRQSKQLTEGLAVWVETKVLEAFGYHRQVRYLLTRMCLFYGEGARVIVKMERELGVGGTLERVKLLKDIEDKYEPRRPRKREADGSYLA